MSIVPLTIREQITNQIRNDVVSGHFPAGSTLREHDLASKLGVSRGPIRDAFIQLSNEGFLSYQANRGVTVRHPPNPADRTFITSVRKQIEFYIIGNGIEDVTESEIAVVETALAALKTDCDGGDAGLIARSDILFHESILTVCGGEDMLGAWRQLCSRMLLAYTRHDNYGQTYREHAGIFEAFRKKDKDATFKALEANIK